MIRTFEAYCKDRWGMTKTHANRLIGAAEVTDALAPIGAKPLTEAVARELTGIRDEEGKPDPVKQAAAWQEAVETATVR
jgi:hypothetical protein